MKSYLIYLVFERNVKICYNHILILDVLKLFIHLHPCFLGIYFLLFFIDSLGLLLKDFYRPPKCGWVFYNLLII